MVFGKPGPEMDTLYATTVDLEKQLEAASGDTVARILNPVFKILNPESKIPKPKS
jgi:hypothetical protein